MDRLQLDQLPKDDASRLVEAVARGEYNLLLGAGASIGATGGGIELPLADAFAKELIHDFALPVGQATTNLPFVYEAVGPRRDSQGRSLEDFLRWRFTDCTPATWHSHIPAFTWKRLWTLNIDDTIEIAYRTAAVQRQSLRSLSWRDRHTDPDLGDVQVVHLHGKASDPTGLVFSILEYFEATTAQHAWHSIFADHFQEKPFIVVGASLHSEFDLAPVIRRGNSARKIQGLPSLYVSPIRDRMQEEFVEKHGLIPVLSTPADFFSHLRKAVATAEVTLKTLIHETGSVVPPEAQTFLEQFLPLRIDSATPKTRHDFYHGYDPVWHDVLDDKDAVFEAPTSVVQSIVASSKHTEPTQRLELIYGPWGTGKSTALLRAARDLIPHGFEPWLFRSDATLNNQAADWWIGRRPKTLLLFDGAADFAVELEALLQSAKSKSKNAWIIATERRARLRHVRTTVSAPFLSDGAARFMRSLSDNEIRALLAKLEGRSRLGRITRWERWQQELYFERDARRHLFTAMSGLEGGPGFLIRLKDVFAREDLTRPLKDVLGVCAFSYEFGYPLPLAVAARATGIDANSILLALAYGPLADWLDIGKQGIRLRHRRIATLIVEQLLDLQERYRLTLSLARSLAPYITPGTIRQRKLPYLIIRNILDADLARLWFRPLVVKWYEELEPAYSWNARYWEQRSIAYLRIGDVATSRSYAEKALSTHEDPFSLTTLANIMLQQQVKAIQSGQLLSEGEYSEAVEYLQTARDTSRSGDPFPYTVFFLESLRILRLGTPNEQMSVVVRALDDWFATAWARGLGAAADIGPILDRAKREYRRITNESGASS